MFSLETKDFKLLFEYDTEAELRLALEQIKDMQITQAVERYSATKSYLSGMNENTISELNFTILRDKYIARRKEDGTVSEDSVTAYMSTFKLLIEYFNDKQIETITIDEYDGFKDSLKTHIAHGKLLQNRTINKHINYLKAFIKFAHTRNLISANNVHAVTLRDEKKDKMARKATIKNYTNTEVKKILAYNYEEPWMKMVVKIALYTGMRQGDIYGLKNNLIKQEDGIYYFDIIKAKTLAGIRQVPIHKDILEDVLSFDFNVLQTMSDNAFGKNCRSELYKVIPMGQGKNFHTIRGTFSAKALHSNLYKDNTLSIIQEIIGHEKEEKVALTEDTYAKYFPLIVKKELIDTVSYL